MSRSDRRGSFANTAIWTCAVVAIAALTVWNFEIWPVGWVETETGTLGESAASGERLAVAPIEVAGPGGDAPQPVEPAGGTAEIAPPPAELASLDLQGELRSVPDRAPPSWPAEPARLPQGGDPEPIGGGAPAPLPTGSDFAETGLFPEATTPRAPQQPAEPTPLEPGSGSELRPAGGQTNANDAGSSSILPTAAQSPGLVQARTPAPQQPATGVTTAAASAAAPVDPRIVAVDADMAGNRYLAAHKSLSKLYWDEPSLRPTIQTRIDTTAKSIYFDPQPHYMAAYEVQPGDQLRVFAQEYDVPWEYLVRLNRIADPGRIQAGERIKVIKGPFSAVVNLSDFTLTVHAHGYYVRRYPVGVGQDGTTPVGAFRVVLKEFDPKYWGPDGVVMEREDPANPLGERWIGLDDGSGRPTSYGIHGTIDPGSIGRAESRGCVRMRNEDVAEVYDLLGTGSEVVVQR